MDGQGEEREVEAPPRFESGLVAQFLPLVVAVTAIVAFATEFGLAWWAAAAAIAAIVGVAAAVHMPGRRRVVARPAALGRTAWPDAGLKVVVGALPDPAFIIDQRGRLRYGNAAAASIFGTLRVGDPLSFKLRVPAFLEAVDRVSVGGTTERIAWTEKVPTERWFEAFIAPLALPAGEAAAARRPDFVLVLVRDLTENHMVDRLRADFVANASHELRTPLAAVSGFIETLQGPARNDPAARERFLGVMAEQASRMKRLIDDLLSLSRIEMRAHVPLTADVDVAELAGHAVETLAPLAEDLGVRMEMTIEERPLLVRGDRDELLQVFTNLVENALKYGASGGRVVVSASAERGADRCSAVVRVRDFGPGIAPEHLPRITERFYRVDVATSRAKQGTGLGLAIVKHIIGRHRGRLSIESPADGGALFTVRLDRLAADPAPSVSASQINEKEQQVDMS